MTLCGNFMMEAALSGHHDSSHTVKTLGSYVVMWGEWQVVSKGGWEPPVCDREKAMMY